MTDERVSLEPAVCKKYVLVRGERVIVHDASAAAEVRTLDRVVARAQALSRKLIDGKAGASVDDFVTDRAREIAGQWQRGSAGTII